MNLFPIKHGKRAFTLVELLVVIAIIGILAALLLPVLEQAKKRAKRVLCESNLRQVGVAFHNFGHDHDGKLPMQVMANAGGAEDYITNALAQGYKIYMSFQQFQVLSNDLVTTKILVCPADTLLPAKKFGVLQNSNLSYFINIQAELLDSGNILAGDRNLQTNYYTAGGLSTSVPAGTYHWTRELHEHKGNMLFGDNHVEEWNDKRLMSAAALLAPGSGPTAGSPSSPPTSSANSGWPSSTGGQSPSSSRPPASSGPANSAGQRPPSSTPGTMGNPDGAHPPMPSPGGYGNNPLSKTYGSVDQNLEATNSRRPVMPPEALAITSAAPVDADAAMSPADQQIVKVLHGTVIWSYFLLLLFLLLYLAYKLRQMLRRNKKPGADDAPEH